MSLLAPSLLQKLGRARLNPRRAVASSGIGERRSRAKGAGIEFEDHRPYQIGDDIRHLDRHVHGRLGQHVVKQFAAYQQLPITILLDASASMGYGAPQKLGHAKALAAGLAYAGLAGGDQVLMGAFAGRRLEWHSRVHGPRRLASVVPWLEALRPVSSTDLARTARGAVPRLLSEGLAIIISDFMVENVEEALAVLESVRQEVVCVHVLAPEEIEPDRVGTGDIRFIDLESGQEVETSLDETMYGRYRDALEAWSLELRDLVHDHHGRYLRVRSDDDLERIFLREWRTEGLIG